MYMCVCIVNVVEHVDLPKNHMYQYKINVMRIQTVFHFSKINRRKENILTVKNINQLSTLM